MIRFVFFALLTLALPAQAQRRNEPQPRKLVVISVDGMDARYLNDADTLGLKVPNLRRLRAAGSAASGVVGVVPTVTWPSHTTMITGVTPDRHGIPTNDQPGKPGQRWWFTSYLKAKTLWQTTTEAGRPTATINWPVTVGATSAFNIPEFWEQRSEHEIAFAPMAKRSTTGLIDRIARAYPGFVTQNWDDRSGMTAVRFLLETEKPVLTLVHIADLDAESHEKGAFTAAAKAVLERQDQLIGWALEKLLPNSVVAIVSDHGFENVDHVLRPKMMLKAAGVSGDVEVADGLIGAKDSTAAAYLRRKPLGIAREVSMDEVRRMAPQHGHWTAAFETSPGYLASSDAKGEPQSEGNHQGTHGLWPTRAGYRASFWMSGAAVKPEQLGEISMLDIYAKLAQVLGVSGKVN